MKGTNKEIIVKSFQIFKTLLESLKGNPAELLFKIMVLGYLGSYDSQD